MYESRTLRVVIVLFLYAVVSTAAHAGSSVRHPEFPPPNLAIERAVVEKPEPRAWIDLARAVYSAVFRPVTEVNVFNANTHETATFYIAPDGKLVNKAERRLMRTVFRCRRTGRRRNMHPGALRILADVARQYPGHTIEIVSAYRAPPFGVPNSKHFHGRAIDLRVRNVSIKEVRDYLWRTHDHVGLGYYRGQNFIHVDYRPGNHKLGWTSPRRGAKYRYHPKWSRAIAAVASR